MEFLILAIIIIFLIIVMKNISSSEKSSKSSLSKSLISILLFITFTLIYYFLIAMCIGIILNFLGLEEESFYSLVIAIGLSPILSIITLIKFYRLKDFNND